MIGNLFNTFAITIMSGLFAIGGVTPLDDQINNSVDYTPNTTLTFNDNEYDVYGQTAFAMLKSYHYSQIEYDYNINTQTRTVIDDADNGEIRDVSNLSSVVGNVGLEDYQISCVIEKYNDVFYTRFFVPFNSPVDALLLHFNASVGVYYWETKLGTLQPMYNTKPVSIMLHDSTSFEFSNSSSFTVDAGTTSACSRFMLYSFRVQAAQVFVNTFTIEATFLQGKSEYQTGYDIGYSAGYSAGSTDGYNAGYAEGLNLNTNSSFMGLFNAVADTPLRFLYGLFNFDLFGVSCLVIILSLLTFSVTFAIVKKVWK